MVTSLEESGIRQRKTRSKNEAISDSSSGTNVDDHISKTNDAIPKERLEPSERQRDGHDVKGKRANDGRKCAHSNTQSAPPSSSSRIQWNTFTNHGNHSSFLALAFVVTLLLIVHHQTYWSQIPRSRPSSQQQQQQQPDDDAFRIIFTQTFLENCPSSFLRLLDKLLGEEERGPPDYGVLDWKSIELQDLQSLDTAFDGDMKTNNNSNGSTKIFDRPTRLIDPDDDYNYELYRSEYLDEVDEVVNSMFYGKDDLEDRVGCRNMDWVFSTFATCNGFHETLIERPYDGTYQQDYRVSYLSSGEYRAAWRFQQEAAIGWADRHDDFVVKRYHLDMEFDAQDLHESKHEANLMERYSDSPLILNIYGACGTSVAIETMAGNIHTHIIPEYDTDVLAGLAAQSDLNELDDVYPNNNMTASEKLQIALYMAESLVLMHENDDGSIIINDDTHIEQWLLAPDGSIKLNDMQNSKVLKRHVETGKSCAMVDRFYGGTYRAPEEYNGEPQDEKKDVYAFGQNIYCLLTGLFPFYDEQYRGMEDHKIIQIIINGERPFVDERYKARSFIEGQLVDIMQRCWHPERWQRPAMSQLVAKLREVKAIAYGRGELEPSKWILIPTDDIVQ